MAGNLGNSNVTDPNQAKWGDLDSSEKGARVMAGGIKGLGQGIQSYQAQNAAMRQGGGGVQVPMAQQPQVQLPGMNGPDLARKPNPFFFGGG